MPAARECLASFLAASAPCLAEEERPGLNVTLDMVDSGLQFACHGDGDRIAREFSFSYILYQLKPPYFYFFQCLFYMTFMSGSVWA